MPVTASIILTTPIIAKRGSIASENCAVSAQAFTCPITFSVRSAETGAKPKIKLKPKANRAVKINLCFRKKYILFKSLRGTKPKRSDEAIQNDRDGLLRRLRTPRNDRMRNRLYYLKSLAEQTAPVVFVISFGVALQPK